MRISTKYRAGVKIGTGTFGDIYDGIDLETDEKVAIKVESLDSAVHLLQFEAMMYQRLAGGRGIPSIRWSGTTLKNRILIMDLLGPSLMDCFLYCGSKFSLKTVLMLADQILERLEYIHSRSLIHRDIKPENFLMGEGDNQGICYIIDFGLAKSFQSPLGEHIPYHEGKNMTGTSRYASINAHLGREQSRRDDLQSLGFMLMYFLRGSLPWQTIQATTPEARYKLILQRKQSTYVNITFGYPMEFKEYFQYCASLGFVDEPDYRYLRNLFRKLFVRLGYEDDGKFDWTVLDEYIEEEMAVLAVEEEAEAAAAETHHANMTMIMTMTMIAAEEEEEEVSPTATTTSTIADIAAMRQPAERETATEEIIGEEEEEEEAEDVLAEGDDETSMATMTTMTTMDLPDDYSDEDNEE